VLSNLFRPSEQRAITAASLFASGDLLPSSTQSGVNVTQDNSLQINAVYACVRVIADSVSTLPMDTFIRRDGERVPYRPRPVWVDRPDIDGQPRSDFWQQVMVSLLIDGNAFVRIIRDTRGDVLGFKVLDPTRVEVKRNAEGAITYYVDNNKYQLSSDEMLHLTELRKPGALRGVSRVDEMRESLGLTQALQSFASRFFGNGSNLSGVIEIPGEVTADQARALQDNWERGHKGLKRSHRPGILSGGARFQATSVSPKDSMAVESRHLQLEEVARLFRVPISMLSTAMPGAMSYASVEEQHIEFVTMTLRPYVHKLEESFSTLLPSDAFLRFSMEGLLRGNITSRYAAYSQGVQAGFLSIADIRRLEDLRPVEGSDTLRVPLANVNLDAANIVEMDKRILMAQRLIVIGFEPSSVMASLGLPDIVHTGLPSVQLQQAATFEPADPAEAYPVRDFDPEDLTEAMINAVRTIPAPIVNVPQPVVNVTVPEADKRVRTVERDDEGNILRIVEE
jgi:HK97 family phage portal protein